jgi:hypothetical protein
MRHTAACLIALCLVLLAACAGTDSGGSITSGQRSVPDDVADFGHFGSIRLGMTAAQLRSAAPGLVESTLGNGCVEFNDATTTAARGENLSVLLTGDDRVVGINVPITARTTKGIGYGSSMTQLKAAYRGFTIAEGTAETGTQVLIRGNGSTGYLGFTVGFDDETVTATRIGTHDFAAGYELCSG